MAASETPVTTLVLASTGRSSDAGHLAAADLSSVAARLGVDYRLIGGTAVTLLVACHGVGDLVPPRETADADFGAAGDVVADPRLPAALTDLGYRRTSGNRFTRPHADAIGELDVTIDVLAPSAVGRLRSNQPHGALLVDEVPGLALALRRPSTPVSLEVRLTSGVALIAALDLPDVVSALCLKAYAYAGRQQPRDALDIWRLLEAASAAGLRVADWPADEAATDAARILLSHFGRPMARGLVDATRSRPHQTRIRALVARVVPGQADVATRPAEPTE
ncbi:MAG: hypothetical protein DLM59_07885 [Pseudonocardiales bacterium]|nr:MAG: hypothetical protein DLM59_07885 [Pseudonocardiales bacterium]